LAYEPRVLLLDEPFSNLDAKLRERARIWLRQLQQQLNLTTIFVTHDQDEAMGMSDRMLVLERGVVQQIGDPKAIYERPVNRFVAGFVGSTNVLEGVVAAAPGAGYAEVTIEALPSPLLVADAGGRAARTPVCVAIRPEAVRFLGSDVQPALEARMRNLLVVRVTGCAFMGDHYRYQLKLGDVDLIAKSAVRVAEGEHRVQIDPDACRVVSASANGKAATNHGEVYA